MKQNLFKTMLLAVALFGATGGVNAQDYSLVDKITFDDPQTFNDGWKILSGANSVTQIDHADGKAMLVTADSRGARDYYYNFTNSDFISSEKWKMEFDFAASTANTSSTDFYIYSSASGNSYGQYTSVNRLFLITDGAKYTTTANVYAGNDNTSSLVTLTYEKYKTTPKTWYHIVLEANKDNGVMMSIFDASSKVVLSSTKVCDFVVPKGMSIRAGKGLGSIALDNVMFYVVTEKIMAPEANISSVDETKRTITLSQVAGNDIYYYTTDETYSTEGLTATKYTEPIVISAKTYIVAYAQKGTKKSEEVKYEFAAGDVIYLNKASISLGNYTRNADNIVFPEFSISAPNNSNLLLSPKTENLEYSFTPDGGTESARVKVAPGAMFTPTAKGVLKVYASTTGYGESVYEMPVSAKYNRNFKFDFDKIANDEYVDKEGWELVTSGWWQDAVAYKSTAKNATTVGRVRFGNNTVTNLVIGWGIGRNSNNCSLKLRNYKSGEINVLDINSDTKGVDKSLVETKTFYAIGGDGAETSLSPEFYIDKLKTIRKISVYEPAEATDLAPISSAAFATYSPSSNVIVPSAESGIKVYTAKVEGNQINLTQVEAGKVLKVGTGYVVAGEENSYKFDLTKEATEAIEGNDLKVATGEGLTATADTKYYVLTKRAEGVGFGKVAEGVNIPAGKCYIDLTATASKATFLSFGGETTGISNMEAAKANTNEYFSLQGVKTMKPNKGIYIHNGKKVVIK